MNRWIDIGVLDDIPRRGARKVVTDAGCVAVFRTEDDRIFAIDSACPHKGGPLNDGIVHGHSVTCPLHNWVISLETGEVQGLEDGRVATFPASVQDGRILLDAEHLANRAVA